MCVYVHMHVHMPRAMCMHGVHVHIHVDTGGVRSFCATLSYAPGLLPSPQ